MPPRKRVRAPAGQRVELEEKGVSGKDPFQGSQYLKAYSSYLGQWDPEAISITTMLKMLHHPAIALAEHVIWAPLVHADWDIECPDEAKRKFVRAVIEPIYLKMMLFSLPAISLGFAAFTKQWGTYLPYDDDIDVTELLDLKAMLRRSGVPEGRMERLAKDEGGESATQPGL